MKPVAASRFDLRVLSAWGHHLFARLGPWGLAAALLWALVPAAGALAWRFDTDTERLRVQATGLLQQRPETRPADASARPASLLDSLPEAAQAADFVEHLHLEAQRAGVTIDRAEYRAPGSPAPLNRLQVVLPASGSYAAMARWLDAVLRRHPSAAIDELALQRDGSGAVLRARVVFSHYSRLPG